MKKITAIILCVLCLAALLMPTAAADENYNEYYRINDYIDAFSQEELYALEDKICTAIEQYDFDMAVCITDNLYESSIEEYADWFYTYNNMGSGPDGDGLLLMIDIGAADVYIDSFGIGSTLFDYDTKEAIYGEIIPLLADALETGDFYAAVDRYIDLSVAVLDDYGLPETDNIGKPYWYPANVKQFERFHDPDAPNVVDNADIFTDAEEANLSDIIQGIIDKYNYDLVLFTDESSYGLSRAVYAADFYHFNGYGIGPNYSGSVLLICMEPGNRGWWTAGTGDCEYLYASEANINNIDDRIEPDMKNGEYYEAMLKYFAAIDELYANGSVAKQKHYFVPVVVGLIAGLIVGGIVIGILLGLMKKVKEATSAEPYLDLNSFNVRKSRDHYLYTSVTKVRRQSSSSGGRSSHSSGYSSSGGGSYSGGGRSF